MSKVTAYTELTAPSTDDMLYIVDSAAGASPTGKKVKAENLVKGGLGVPTSGAVLVYSTAATSGAAWSKPTSASVLSGSSLGVPAWTAAGTSGQVLTIVDTHPEWAAPAAAGGGSSAINLPAAAWSPTGNGSSMASAQLSVYQSAGSLPSPRLQEWLFDPTTNEYIVTQFRVPPNYTGASAPTLTVQYYSTAAVASGVAWGVRVMGLPTSGVLTNVAYGATAATSTPASFALPSSAFALANAAVTITEGSSLFVAGNLCQLALFRNAVGNDSAAGDMHVLGCEFAYS